MNLANQYLHEIQNKRYSYTSIIDEALKESKSEYNKVFKAPDECKDNKICLTKKKMYALVAREKKIKSYIPQCRFLNETKQMKCIKALEKLSNTIYTEYDKLEDEIDNRKI